MTSLKHTINQVEPDSIVIKSNIKIMSYLVFNMYSSRNDKQ